MLETQALYDLSLIWKEASYVYPRNRELLTGQATYGSTGTPMILNIGFAGARICSVGYKLLDGTAFLNQGIQADIMTDAFDESLLLKALEHITP